MIRIRMHRGGLEESMKTMFKCEGVESIIHYLIMHNVDVNTVKVELYDDNFHEAIGWDKTYIIMGNYKDVKDDTIYPLGFADSHFTLPKIRLNIGT